MNDKKFMPMTTNQTQTHLDRRSMLKIGLAGVAGLGFSKSPLSAAAQNELGFVPTAGYVGDTIRLFGINFGNELANIHVRIVGDNSQVAFLRSLDLDGSDLLSSIEAVPPAMLGGIFEVTLGTGAFANPTNMQTGLTLLDPIWCWQGTAQPPATSYQEFEFPEQGTSPCNTSWGGGIHGPLTAQILIPNNKDCCAICPIGSRLTLRFSGQSGQSLFAYDATLVTTLPLTAFQIADALAALVSSAFDSELSTHIPCFFNQLTNNEILFQVYGPAYSNFQSGNMQITIAHGGDPCDSLIADSNQPDSVPPDSTPGDSACFDSVPCESVAADFYPFTFTYN